MKKRYIKYSLFGFNQLKAHELGLDLVDLALLRWFIDFKDFKDNTGKKIMISKVIDNEVMYWVQYDGVKEALPIAKLSSADSVYRRFKKMVKAEILEHKTVKQGGIYSYYAVGKKYCELISEEYKELSDKNPIGTDRNPIGTDENPDHTDKNPEQNINLINKSNINKSNIYQSSIKKDLIEEDNKEFEEKVKRLKEETYGSFKYYDYKKLLKAANGDVDLVLYVYENTLNMASDENPIKNLVAYMKKAIENELEE